MYFAKYIIWLILYFTKYRNVSKMYCAEYTLLRSDAIEDGGDDGEDYVRQPQRPSRRKGVRVDEHFAELHEQDVGEAERDADTDVPAYAAATFL